jgi:lipopolysaccharide export LptBFGC system permease protein LptF
MEIFTNIAQAALALLVAALAVYLSLRLMGKIAKFVITVVVVIVLGIVLWKIFGSTGGSLPVLDKIMALKDIFK